MFIFACLLAHFLGILWFLLGDYEVRNGIEGNWLEFFNHLNSPWYARYVEAYYCKLFYSFFIYQ